MMPILAVFVLPTLPALKQIEDSSQKGTFHFVDHYEASITRAAVILDDLIPFYYDAARDLTVRKAAVVYLLRLLGVAA